MSMVNASIAYKPSNSNNASHFHVPFSPFPIHCPSVSSRVSSEAKITRLDSRGRKGILLVLTVKRELIVDLRSEDDVEDEEGKEGKETLLYSFNPLALVLLRALPGASAVRSLFGLIIELIDMEPSGLACPLGSSRKHGATGGVTSLLTSDRPIFESRHAVPGIIGLSLLTIQTILPLLFEFSYYNMDVQGNSEQRNVHGILGCGIMTLFLVHAALGIQLGLSY
ncbi:hypothetical protein AKJ16_DCAP21115 [Drosera capensis]